MTLLIARTVMIGVCLWGGFMSQSWAQGLQEKGYPPYTPRLAVPGQPIAGIPHEEALKIYERHEEELRKLPGSVSVSFYADGIVVETASPAALPAAVEGLPVIPVPPVDPRAAMGIDEALSSPPPSSEPIKVPGSGPPFQAN